MKKKSRIFVDSFTFTTSHETATSYSFPYDRENAESFLDLLHGFFISDIKHLFYFPYDIYSHFFIDSTIRNSPAPNFGNIVCIYFGFFSAIVVTRMLPIQDYLILSATYIRDYILLK